MLCTRRAEGAEDEAGGAAEELLGCQGCWAFGQGVAFLKESWGKGQGRTGSGLLFARVTRFLGEGKRGMIQGLSSR